ncbi:MFS transporter [uncultured Aquitalea sp.]|uniref:MFS transporter n=1 Tax=uncultured Aquitalea sp. TaxID=540272 RepID=UPI0025ED1EE6|nr:MFS transporter [uncultured Aquitalea sp.]
MSNAYQVSAGQAVGVITQSERRVIFASSLGTVFEWYDFFLYGALASIISKQFFAGVNDTTAFIFALMTFAAGFLVRPFGALVFGRLGDMIGRKYTFLATIILMGLSTFLVGVLPNYASIGIAAPILLVVLRMLQGLAIGGEYGGAAIYVAEHAPDHKRGSYTSWIQVTATGGLLLSLLVILACRQITGDDFNSWGWRLPFLISLLLLGISTWIRLSMHESPAFLKMKAEGKHSKAPLTESFTNWQNLRIVLISLFGINGGQAVTFYCAQFYSLFFLTQILKVDAQSANLMLVAALIISAPLFLFFGKLSDRIGRKPILMAGFLLGALLTFPAFKGLTLYASPDIAHAQQRSPVTVVADPTTCHFLFDPVGKAKLDTACDKAKSLLAKSGIPYQEKAGPAGSMQVMIGSTTLDGFDKDKLLGGLKAAGYPDKADPSKINQPMVVLMLVLLCVFSAMTYGPLAALMVELFPTRIRYTSMSLPYHLGNGWIGGLLPTVAFSLVVYTGDIFYGLWYPVIVCVMSFVVSLIALPETYRRDIHQH